MGLISALYHSCILGYCVFDLTLHIALDYTLANALISRVSFVLGGISGEIEYAFLLLNIVILFPIARYWIGFVEWTTLICVVIFQIPGLWGLFVKLAKNESNKMAPRIVVIWNMRKRNYLLFSFLLFLIAVVCKFVAHAIVDPTTSMFIHCVWHLLAPIGITIFEYSFIGEPNLIPTVTIF
jgi:hypothetical protein